MDRACGPHCPDYCPIDFGTSNSALGLAVGTAGAGMRLAVLEDGLTTMPTAVFYDADDGARLYGRAAIAAYVDGVDGRLMRSIKSILGSDLMDETTEYAAGRAVRYIDVVVAYLRQLRLTAEAQAGRPLVRVVLGRPVFFVDDDPVRDRKAQDTLAAAAQAAGFTEVAFQYEPIAAALDFESTLQHETLVLVADIGGGTSDFSVVRASPARHGMLDRRADVLANHGVHVAGTDFDRAVNLAAIMPLLGLGSRSTRGHEVPSSIYFNLATWHLINTTYTPLRLAQLRQLRPMYADPQAFERLARVLRQRLGHLLAGRAEAAKIEAAQRGASRIGLEAVERGLHVDLDAPAQARALAPWIERIVAAAGETCAQAGVPAQAIEALYFTGGSTGLTALTDALAARFARARRASGERFSSVVQGLAISAQRRFAPTRAGS